MLTANAQTADLSGFSGGTVYVTIAYSEQQTDPSAETGVTGRTRWTEAPVIDITATDPEDPSTTLILGRVVVGADGKITSTDEGVEPNRRRAAGVAAGDLEVRSLTLGDPRVATAGWPRMRLGAPNRADLQGSLAVSGDVEPAGKVDGRDVAADGTKLDQQATRLDQQATQLDQHVNRKDNPHATTAAQVNALTSIDGVSNPGGNIDLVAANTVTITPNDAGNQITIGESHSARSDNPHNTTAAQVGAPTSIDGVSNPGGNIDLVAANTVTIAPNDAGNQITIGESHSARTDNPHNITAAQVGAVPQGTSQTGRTLQLNSSLGSNNPVLFIWHGNPTALWGILSIVNGQLSSHAPGGAAALSGVSELPDVAGVYAKATAAGTSALRVEGPATFTAGKGGYVVDTFVNASGSDLRTGDVVRLVGSPVVGYLGALSRIPVAEVTPVDSPDDPRVIGIVEGEAIPSPDEPDERVNAEDPTVIEPGGRLNVVTLGCFAHCRVDASKGPIAAGDLLTSSDNPGHAKKSEDFKLGTIIGKALEPLAEGSGYISVFVNIQ